MREGVCSKYRSKACPGLRGRGGVEQRERAVWVVEEFVQDQGQEKGVSL